MDQKRVLQFVSVLILIGSFLQFIGAVAQVMIEFSNRSDHILL